jgi:serine phosphatase RsbU (regulator of sigma subunit)
VTWKARQAWDARKAWWLELITAVAVVVVIIVCAAHVWTAPLLLAPLLAVPPALAGVGASNIRRPLAYGAVSLVAAVVIAVTASGDTHEVPVATIVAVVVMTAISVAATTASSDGQIQQIANVISVAETAQRAVLKPLPSHLGPVELGVIYLAAAADAKVGGDLYDVTTTEHGIRLIMGDVRGKGLGAVEVAADVLGMYREVAHDVHTLGELARRLDAGLSRRWGEHEEFVTALFVEIDPQVGRLSIFNCGHPPPILISADGVTVLEVPAPAPPLGLLTLGDSSGAARTLTFKPNDQLLLYTDGVTEARDQRRRFYPLDERLIVLQTRGKADGGGLGLLEAIRDDLLRHSGAPLEDDAALLLVRAPAVWPSPAAGRRQDTMGSRP